MNVAGVGSKHWAKALYIWRSWSTCLLSLSSSQGKYTGMACDLKAFTSAHGLVLACSFKPWKLFLYIYEFVLSPQAYLFFSVVQGCFMYNLSQVLKYEDCMLEIGLLSLMWIFLGKTNSLTWTWNCSLFSQQQSMVRLKPGCTTFLDPELTTMRQVTGALQWHTVQMAQGAYTIFTLRGTREDRVIFLMCTCNNIYITCYIDLARAPPLGFLLA